jgi:hypothetical protein
MSPMWLSANVVGPQHRTLLPTDGLDARQLTQPVYDVSQEFKV